MFRLKIARLVAVKGIRYIQELKYVRKSSEAQVAFSPQNALLQCEFIMKSILFSTQILKLL